jgi:GntR family transcriptional regulator
MVPKHEQLRALLTEQVTTRLRPGDALPGERRLCLEHGVSRITVRAAIGQLVSDGLLVRVRGKGTFVAGRTARSSLHIASFSEDMRRMGLTPTTAVLSVERGVPAAVTAAAFGLAGGEAAHHVRRLRLADGAPMAVDDAWYHPGLAPDLDRRDLSGSIYRMLAEQYGREIDHAEQTAGAVEAGAEVAALLGIPLGRAVLTFDRLSSSGGRVVEHARSWYRADRYELRMSLDRQHSG